MDNNDINVSARGDVEYRGYNLFNQVKNPMLKAWNRMVTYLNILSQKGKQSGKEYFNLFSPEDKQPIHDLLVSMKHEGYAKTHKRVWDTLNGMS